MPRLLPLEDLKAPTMAAFTPVQITPGAWGITLDLLTKTDMTIAWD